MIKFAIIGASYLQLPLVIKAKEKGLYTICFAWDEGAVCKNVCDKFYSISILEKEKIYEICQAERISGITSIASDLAVIAVCYVAEKMRLAGNSIESSITSTNKYLQRKTLLRAGINVPKFENASNLTLWQLEHEFTFPLIVKPVDRSGSKGVIVIKTPGAYANALEYASKASIQGEAIVEEFIEGEEISVEAVSWHGDHVILAFTDKITSGYPHFVELEHHQPSKYWLGEVHDLILSTVKSSLNILGIQNGASHSEFIITKKREVFVTEIAARMGGDFIGSHLVQLSTGFDFLNAIIDVALGENPRVELTDQHYSGVCFYSRESKWVADFIKSGCPNIVEWHLDLLSETLLRESSQRSGYFIYAGDQKIQH